jgi:hypothetical protein
MRPGDGDLGYGERDMRQGERDLDYAERDFDAGRRDAGVDDRIGDDAISPAAGSRRPRADRPTDDEAGQETDADLVPAASRSEFESRWREIQAMFVDEPREAVGRANALLDEVMRSVMSGFSERTAALEQRPDAQANTEQLRQALRSYRALFDRVLYI